MMEICINDMPFPLAGLDALQIKLLPLSGFEIIRAEDGTLLHTPHDSRMEIILEGKGQIHPHLCDVQKGEKFTLSHPLPLWTMSPVPPRGYKGALFYAQGKTGYLPIFSCVLSNFEIKTELVEVNVSFRFVFEEI